MKQLEDWLSENRAEEVECLVPDMSGIARGKILPAKKFIQSVKGHSLRLPESVFIQTVTGGYADDEDDEVTSVEDVDVVLQPDESTIRVVPWYEEPTGQVINDAYYNDGTPVEIASRYVLRKVLDLYDERGWKPVVAPELEFFLVQVNTDPDLPLIPPIGQSGRPETGRQSYGIDAVNEFAQIGRASGREKAGQSVWI